MAASQRKIFDCRNYPSDTHCSVAISGTEEEVLDEAVHHAMTKHGKEANPHLRDQLRLMLEDEK
jgi:predicted small metal-binding protein